MTSAQSIATTDSGAGGRYPQSTVRAFGVIVLPPGFDDDLRLAEAVESLTVQQLAALRGR